MRPALWALCALALAPARFETATVRLSPWYDGVCPQSIKMDPAGVTIECGTLRTLIGYAFGFSPERIQGPRWLLDADATRFDIAAKIPPGEPLDRVPAMLQTLLAERFQVELHRATNRQEIYALVVAKAGITLKPAGPPITDPDAPSDALGFFGDVQTRTTPNPDGVGSTTRIANPRMGTVLETEGRNRTQQWHAPSISFEGLADLLDKVAPVPLPVINMTGLQGRYELILEVAPHRITPAGDMHAEVLDAFNEGLLRLGLRLERRTAPIEMLVVDHAEKAPTASRREELVKENEPRP
jgi:uncharacterized protein (TIGR03435 family)